MKFVLGIIAGIILVAAAGFVYFRFGFAPVATSAAPMPLETTLAQWALEARIEKEMPVKVPIVFDPANVKAGSHVYVENCAMCHGLPQNREAPFHEAIFPHPPQLFEGVGVTDDPPGKVFWLVTNGIRMTGMPSFGYLLNDEQRWQVSLMLTNADKLPADVRTFLETSQLSK
jgi:thiosulfate dehydrogenase